MTERRGQSGRTRSQKPLHAPHPLRVGTHDPEEHAQKRRIERREPERLLPEEEIAAGETVREIEIRARVDREDREEGIGSDLESKDGAQGQRADEDRERLRDDRLPRPGGD
jgi:hypothetical protein